MPRMISCSRCEMFALSHIGTSNSKASGAPDPVAGDKSVVGGMLKRIGWRKMEVTAIDGINLDLHAGDRIGIMGSNGAGKSTLLRIMAGIYPPSSGTVETSGRVSAVLGQTHGMDQDMTGYENIRIRGLFMGLSNEEIEERTAEIVEYCELGAYLDMPLRVYSPGMRIRLGFSITTCFRPDILLLDEWLSAGDQGFRKKAIGRMQEFVDSARSVVVVSHNRALLEQFCAKILIMENGKVIRIETVSQTEEEQGNPLHMAL
jgi:lipopolysaccharide transport system ATP-binding protein